MEDGGEQCGRACDRPAGFAIEIMRPRSITRPHKANSHHLTRGRHAQSRGIF